MRRFSSFALVAASVVIATVEPEARATGGLDVLPTDKQRVSLELADGKVEGGHFGAPAGVCSGRTQAFVRRVGGGSDWERCQAAPADGTCTQGGGLPLFAGLSCYDRAYIASSSVHDIAEEPTGDLLVTGEALLAWESGPNLDVVTARNAFVLRLSSGGVPLSSTCLGPAPAGPPAHFACCGDLCPAPGGGGGWCGGRGVAPLSSGGVVVTGWCQPTAANLAVDQDYFLVGLSPDLRAQDWIHQAGSLQDDVGLAVAQADDGTVWMTGSLGDDIMVGKLAPGATEIELEVGSGPERDQGQALDFDAAGNVLLSGTVNDEATFGGATLGGPGDGKQAFEATLDQQMQVISHLMFPTGQLLPKASSSREGDGATLERRRAPHKAQPFQFPGPPIPAPPPGPEPPSPTEYLQAIGVKLLVGREVSGSLESLLTSDDDYLILAESTDPSQPENPEMFIRFQVDFEPELEPFELSSLSLELLTESCYTATLALRGFLSGELFVVAHGDVCAADEPILTALVPSHISAALGLDGSRTPQVGDLLTAEVTINYHHATCQGCTVNEEDASVDNIDPDY